MVLRNIKYALKKISQPPVTRMYPEKASELSDRFRGLQILRNDMNIISSISVTDIVLMIIWGNEIIELFPK